jgi:hypothetical protein
MYGEDQYDESVEAAENGIEYIIVGEENIDLALWEEKMKTAGFEMHHVIKTHPNQRQNWQPVTIKPSSMLELYAEHEFGSVCTWTTHATEPPTYMYCLLYARLSETLIMSPQPLNCILLPVQTMDTQCNNEPYICMKCGHPVRGP